MTRMELTVLPLTVPAAGDDRDLPRGNMPPPRAAPGPARRFAAAPPGRPASPARPAAPPPAVTRGRGVVPVLGTRTGGRSRYPQNKVLRAMASGKPYCRTVSKTAGVP